MEIHQYIDHTLLKATATEAEIEQLCSEARTHHFYAVCVNGTWAAKAKALLKDSKVKLAVVVGFPLGAMHTAAKVAETRQALSDGADEIDMVIHLGWATEGHWDKVADEIKAVKTVCGDAVLKVIIETCYLNEAGIVKASEACLAGGADFVKTSTGFGSGGATFEAVKTIRNTIGQRAQIKASGGIKTKETALKYISMGVNRLGTSSGVMLVS